MRALIFFALMVFIVQCHITVCYRSEVEITPSPIEEQTTKKSGGFFGGIKSFFRGSTSTTTVAPPFQSNTAKGTPSPNLLGNGETLATTRHAPLMPLGPRPDTPPSSPLNGNSQNPFEWPKIQTTSTTVKPIFPQQPHQGTQSNVPIPFGSGSKSQTNLLPGSTPYRPPKQQPSGFDLSYGNHGDPKKYPGSSLQSTSTTSTLKPPLNTNMNIDLRGGPSSAQSTTKRPQSPIEDFPALPSPRRSSADKKEDFPSLPIAKDQSSTPPSPVRPSSPSAWNKPLNIPNQPDVKPTVLPPAIRTYPSTTPTPGNRVAFVPHSVGSSTTIRPGFESQTTSLATDDEIRALTEELYQKETNSQLQLIQIELQGKTRSIDSTDEAPKPLLVVDEKALESPAISKMRLLFNNYESDTLVNEHVTPNERKEENDFLDSIMSSSVMRHTMQFLQKKGLVGPDPKTHRDLVKELWFTQYSRGQGKIGSSGFEHVFVNEVKNGTIIGLHNWVYFYEEEKAGRLDYKGYIKELSLGNKAKVLKLRFTHNNLNKPVNTLFIGSSPELELALYTLCFKLKADRSCPISLGNSQLSIVTYSWRYRGKNLIGSAYPEI